MNLPLNAPESDEPLKRVIGPLGFGAITLNGVIGAGIFALPAVAAARVGNFSPWLFLLCAVLIFTIVLAFARAASFERQTGGPIAYATHAFGPFVGFQTGWVYYLSRLAAMAANTNLLVTYAAWYWPALDDGIVRHAAISVILLALTAINYVGVRASLVTVYVLTAMKLVPLLLLILMGLASLRLELLTHVDLPRLDGFGETVLVLLYAFIGFENSVIQAGEARNPRRDIPRALVQTVLLIAVIYFLLQWVSMSVLPGLADTERPLADAAVLVMGAGGALLLSLGAVFSIGGNCSASIMSAPRMTYAMARDGSLPAWFGRVHPRYRTPGNSVLFYGLASLGLAVSGTFIFFAVISTVARLLMYVVSILSLPRLKQKIGEQPGQFRLPGGMTIPVIALVLCAWLLAQADAVAWVATLGLMAVGAGLYALARRAHREAIA